MVLSIGLSLSLSLSSLSLSTLHFAFISLSLSLSLFVVFRNHSLLHTIYKRKNVRVSHTDYRWIKPIRCCKREIIYASFTAHDGSPPCTNTNGHSRNLVVVVVVVMAAWSWPRTKPRDTGSWTNHPPSNDGQYCRECSGTHPS